MVEPLEHDDVESGAREVRGRDERVVPTADDDDVMGVRVRTHAASWPIASDTLNPPARRRRYRGRMPLPEDLLTVAIEIAREAGELARRRRTEGVAVAATKSALADIVTEADREVEALIRSRLAERRPGDGFLGEESGASVQLGAGTAPTSRGSSIRSTAPSTTRTASPPTR